MDSNYKGIAITENTTIEVPGVGVIKDNLVTFNPAWFDANPEDFDVITHELMHVVQDNAVISKLPLWITEGLADYARHAYGINNEKGGWRLLPPVKSEHYTMGYKTAARFFGWIEQQYAVDIAKDLNARARANTFKASFWTDKTGKTVDELWTEYVSNPALK